jgi:hypothetical protein
MLEYIGFYKKEWTIIFMGDQKINAEKFAEVYIDRALFFLLMRRNFNLNSLEKYVDKNLYDKFVISKKDINFLRNYFHWTFFNGNPDSPFEYVMPEKPGNEIVMVKARREINSKDKCYLVDYLFRNYGDSFMTRFDKVFNNSHQQAF